jgi:hypothetical protein
MFLAKSRGLIGCDMGDICYFTSANFAYLGRVRVLARTLKRHNPSAKFVLVLNDKLMLSNGGFDTSWSADEPFDEVCDIEDLGIPNFRSWSFKHNVVELCTAVKASAAKALLSRFERVIYLDPDIAVFGSMTQIVDLLDRYDILLTPHQLSPCGVEERSLRDIELCSLKYGVYNLGFFAVRRGDAGFRFLEWWESRVLRYCYEEISEGIFTDQKWCDIAPCYFPELGVVRHPGCNVASWNLYERELSFADSAVWVNRSWPLLFYHFTKYGGVGEIMTRRYARTVAVLEVWYWYGRQLRRNSVNIPGDGKYFYGYFEDGAVIRDSDRIAYRRNGSEIDNPYDRARLEVLLNP